MNPRAFRQWPVYSTLLPATAIALFAYVGTVVWTISLSVTNSKLVPVDTYVGGAQYARLFNDSKWQLSGYHLLIFCALFITLSLVFGILLAIAIDQKVRGESLFRTLFLYPQGMSFIVTGLVWQWILNPTLGLQHVADEMGLGWLTLDWIANPDQALFVLVLAGTWQASGLVMAIVLAGLRGIDPQLWGAAQLDGVARWRYYVHVVLPELRPIIITAAVLLALGGVKVYELVIAMTNGGPGLSTEVPTKYIMEYLFRRSNIGLATAAATVMFFTVAAIVVPFVYIQYFRKPSQRRPA